MSELIDVVLPADQVEGTRSQVQRWLKAGRRSRSSAPRAAGRDRDRQGDGRSSVARRRRAGGNRRGRRRRRRAGRACWRACGAAAAGQAAAGAAAAPRRRRRRPRRAAQVRRRRRRSRMSPAVRRLLARTRPQRRRRCAAAARAGASRWMTCWRPTPQDAALPAGAPRRATAPAPVEDGVRARSAHADAPAHRRAHGRKPAAHGAARDERVRVRHDGRARRSRGGARRTSSARGIPLTLDGLFRRGLRRSDPRRAGSERPLDRGRDPGPASASTSASRTALGDAGSSFP